MKRYIPILFLTILLTSQSFSQSPSVLEFSKFIKANGQFGRQLLWRAHSSSPGKNIAISPLPVSLAFAALSDSSASVDSANVDEIRHAFGWSEIDDTRGPGRMLIALFEKPKPGPPPKNLPKGLEKLFTPGPVDTREGIWLATQFQYTGRDVLSERFLEVASRDFGLKVGNASGQNGERQAAQRPAGREKFWITSKIHLQTRWYGNIFMDEWRKRGTFTLESGQQEQVDKMPSATEYFDYANTRDFEEVLLPGLYAYTIIVLPARGKNVAEIEQELAQGGVFAEGELKNRLGSVELPKFKFECEEDLRPTLEEMGLHRIFSDLSALSAATKHGIGGQLLSLSQATQVRVDEYGVRTSANTDASGVFGGIIGGVAANAPVPFHMIVNRPFLFFIRDYVTDSLLFEGAVMDPEAK